jgi:Flp pilus assembly protein protease CpaA
MDWHRIPNWLSFGLIAAYYAFALATGVPGDEIVAHTAAGAVAFVAAFAAILGNILHGGVAKLLIAAFVWLGFDNGLTFMILSFVPCAIAGYVARREMPYLPFAAFAALVIVAGPHLLGKL